ncbi:hypothetical protein NDU88_006412 [Pleurodeles waltl]|uniref:Uncharacterized protein n=1 Tax=Pleurodeles waltl TaxID=8319 RepID=A0AAV7WY65_PLEWA|nr:hypothetical protein NDU88_006412 [Pleurodeles waltl]
MRHTSSFFTAASQISAFFCLRLEVCLLARVTASIVFSVYLIVIATFVATSGPEQTFPLERFIFLFRPRRSVPGPGAYDVVGQFEKIKCVPSDVPRAPFLTLSKRFVPTVSATPAPGAYNEVRTAFQTSQKASALAPFGKTAARFTQESRVAKTPGPGAYNIFDLGVAHESLKKAYQESCQKGAFGSSAARALAVSKSEAVWTPGPADYRVGYK